MPARKIMIVNIFNIVIKQISFFKTFNISKSLKMTAISFIVSYSEGTGYFEISLLYSKWHLPSVVDCSWSSAMDCQLLIGGTAQ